MWELLRRKLGAKTMTTVKNHSENFKTLRRAFVNGHVALMECTEKATGEKVAVICAVVFDGKEYTFTPFARFFNDNPYDVLIPPTSEVA